MMDGKFGCEIIVNSGPCLSNQLEVLIWGDGSNLWPKGAGSYLLCSSFRLASLQSYGRIRDHPPPTGLLLSLSLAMFSHLPKVISPFFVALRSPAKLRTGGEAAVGAFILLSFVILSLLPSLLT